MAIGATCVWEMRTTGSANNGGGYTSGGTDYSQQDAAQLNNTDFATSGTGVVTLTSATGGFTAAMVGNVIHLTAGTNLTVGWYEIATYVDTNTVTLDRSPDDGVGGVSSATGYVGGAFVLPTDAVMSIMVAGNKVWIKAGTYTLTGNVDPSNDGTIANPIVIEGYNSNRADNPTGTNRPLIAMGAYYWRGYVSFRRRFRHLRMTGTGNWNLELGDHSQAENCKAENTSGTADREAFRLEGNGASLIDCEGRSTNGTAAEQITHHIRILCCYLHDSARGFDQNGNWLGAVLCHNIIDTCTTGIDLTGAGNAHFVIYNNTIYNSTTGISGSGSTVHPAIFINNIIEACTTGASWTSALGLDFWDYNNWHGNTADVSNVTKGSNATAYDPQFEDAAGGDFRLQAGSSCLGAAFGIRVGVGAASTVDQGAWQAAAGAGGCVRSPIGMTGGMAL